MLTQLKSLLTGRQKQQELRNFRDKGELARFVAGLPENMAPSEADETLQTIEASLKTLGMSPEELESLATHFKKRAQWREARAVAGNAIDSQRALDAEYSRLIGERDAYLASLETKFDELRIRLAPLKTAITAGEEAGRQLKQTCNNPAILQRLQDIHAEKGPLISRERSIQENVNNARLNLAETDRLSRSEDTCEEQLESRYQRQEAELTRLTELLSEAKASLTRLLDEEDQLHAQKLDSEF